MPTAALVDRLRAGLPQGGMLPADSLRTRHHAILLLLWAHVPALFAFGLSMGYPLLHVATEVGIIAGVAALSMAATKRPRVAGTLASLGLMSCSALLVHLSGGFIEAHFHFFVMVIVISLYQDWVPFLIAIGYVLLHHGVVGVLDPRSVYNHPDAWLHPWEWAAIHAVFVFAASAASVVNWKLNERARDQVLAAERASQQRIVENLREMDRLKTSLLNTAGHELNTPLTPLRVQVDMLKDERFGPLNPRQTRAVAVLDRNLERLSALVRDVLDVARMQGGKMELHREDTDVDALVQEVAASFEEPAALAGSTLVVRVASRTTLPMDANRMAQVLFNLLSNALKFTPAGGRVEIRTAARDGDVVIEVEDTGRGMTEAQVARLFQPFSRVHEDDMHVGGTGLGLYITKGIVEQHGGRVGCTSTGPRQGSTFRVTLPIAHNALPIVEAPAPMATADLAAVR